jgi:translation initiation factor eIF-2B subunit delta/methylthioribose-1-phosphate isomerase
MDGGEIRDDRTAGASELARRAIDVIAARATSLGDLAGVRREQERLAALRPSMVAIEGALAIFVELLEQGEEVEAARVGAHDRLERAREGVVRTGVQVLDDVRPRRIVTISCSSTVRAVLEARPPAAILVSEGRPGLEGRTIATGLAPLADEVTVCTDGAIASLLEPGDIVLCGADAVEADGHLVNKVGTFALALAAARASIPFYAACESFKFSSRSGIVLEEMEPSEVWDAPPGGVRVRNPYFERTPPDLVTGFITDRGVRG